MEGNSCGETCNTLQRCQNASLTDRLYCTYIRGSQRTMPTIAAAPDANHDTNDTREGSGKRKCCIPDLDDRRYCRYCRALQPLSVFPKANKRQFLSRQTRGLAVVTICYDCFSSRINNTANTLSPARPCARRSMLVLKFSP